MLSVFPVFLQPNIFPVFLRQYLEIPIRICNSNMKHCAYCRGLVLFIAAFLGRIPLCFIYNFVDLPGWLPPAAASRSLCSCS